ncbi:hypothetical protein EPR50_G00061890 [Perca flavescens]|uniref:Uncharacterized protein n=1 Tax=Perca flavescens TaxID=8167 RepID=A0A484DAD8_PERFV|nr:hypothetical protein EPR50_G00061890 [Perca flavescens]
MKVSRNGSLVIDHFTEDDQGLYSCEKPYSDTVITVKKEILKETAFPVHPCCWGLNSRVEEETSVVYSSVVIRKPAKTTNNHMSCDMISCILLFGVSQIQ